MIGWTGIRCPECGAEIGEDCFETDRIWGKLPYKGPGGNTKHEARILLVLRANRKS